ncbi:MAG TPA: hypothetical protein VHQ45_07880 [Gemmatimonadaceae bacterium]|jgi:amino acid transporter|nr:hypothetical protein [Gemmatimonadaceae bacterium]
MPPPRHIIEEMQLRRTREAEGADRDRRRALMVTALICVAWSALGLFLVGWSLHTTDTLMGELAFTSGVGLGNGGILFTLLDAYRRGERRGDW